MICKETGENCPAPSMCAPYGGCTPRPEKSVKALEERVAELERIVARWHADPEVKAALHRRPLPRCP